MIFHNLKDKENCEKLPERYEDMWQKGITISEILYYSKALLLQDYRAMSSKLSGTMSSNSEFHTFSVYHLKWGTNQRILDMLILKKKKKWLSTQLFFGNESVCLKKKKGKIIYQIYREYGSDSRKKEDSRKDSEIGQEVGRGKSLIIYLKCLTIWENYWKPWEMF